jgi:hypothetical protein
MAKAKALEAEYERLNFREAALVDSFVVLYIAWGRRVRTACGQRRLPRLQPAAEMHRELAGDVVAGVTATLGFDRSSSFGSNDLLVPSSSQFDPELSSSAIIISSWRDAAVQNAEVFRLL